MSRRTRRYDPDDDDADGSDEFGAYHDEDLPLVRCPSCREEILEDAERCPYCGHYISAEDSPAGEPRSRFWVVMMVLALVAVVFMALAG